jgi:hypothetical protein
VSDRSPFYVTSDEGNLSPSDSCCVSAYYFNASTNITSWDKPLAPAAAAPPKPAASPAASLPQPAPAADDGAYRFRHEYEVRFRVALRRTFNVGPRGGFLAEISAGKKLKKVTPPPEREGPGTVSSAPPLAKCKSVVPLCCWSCLC